VALTEAHNGCTREEQLRWLVDVWHAAHDARRDGVDVRAVTAWALFGAYDWNSLVTHDAGYYEPGAWDVRGPTPRPTAIVALLQDLAAGREPDHPVLGSPGWWQQPTRFIYGVAIDDAAADAPRVPLPRRTSTAPTPRSPRPLVITGAAGTLGQAFARLCELRGLPYRLLSRNEMDIAESAGVAAALQALHPWAVVNTAGYVRVDEAERDADTCLRSNAEGPAVLAAACAERGVPLLTFSSDLVFDGQQRTPYVESDAVAPLGVYGHSKALAEARVLETLPQALVVRTSAFFGPWDQHNFVTGALRALAAGHRVVAADDVVVSPTYVPDLVHAALDLLIDGERGVWHLANDGAVSWAELACRAAVLAGFDPAGVAAQPSATLGCAVPRPRWGVLGSERGQQLPSLDDALVRYVEACEHVNK
jgi:dTDP-4-dehydrorhamnose reductase